MGDLKVKFEILFVVAEGGERRKQVKKEGATSPSDSYQLIRLHMILEDFCLRIED